MKPYGFTIQIIIVGALLVSQTHGVKCWPRCLSFCSSKVMKTEAIKNLESDKLGYTDVKKILEGGEGTVYYARKGKKECAVKVFSKDISEKLKAQADAKDISLLEKYQEENAHLSALKGRKDDIMTGLSDESLMLHNGYWTYKEKADKAKSQRLIMEMRYVKTDLGKWVENFDQEYEALPRWDTIFRTHFDSWKGMCHKIMSAVNFAHSNKIVHLDIKEPNILLNIEGDEWNPVLIDWGCAKPAESSLRSLVGTMAYIPMEMFEYCSMGALLRKNKPMELDLYKVDMYAVGVMIHRMVSCALGADFQKNDYYTQSQLDKDRVEPKRLISRFRTACTHLKRKTYLRERGEEIDNLRDLVTGLLAKDPTERLSANEAMNHKFFESFNKKSSQTDITHEEKDEEEFSVSETRHGNPSHLDFGRSVTRLCKAADQASEIPELD